MTYEDFAAAYEALIVRLMAYGPNEVGHGIYASKLADLTEAHPEFEAKYDAALESDQAVISGLQGVA